MLVFSVRGRWKEECVCWCFEMGFGCRAVWSKHWTTKYVHRGVGFTDHGVGHMDTGQLSYETVFWC